MRLAAILALLSTTILVSAVPLSLEDSELGSFNLTDFRFACGTTCGWSFSVAVAGSFPGHPGFAAPVVCGGSTAVQSFTGGSCRPVAGADGEQSVQAYIARGDVLRLRYTVRDPRSLVQNSFFGHTKLYSPASRKRQVGSFAVHEYKAIAEDGQF